MDIKGNEKIQFYFLKKSINEILDKLEESIKKDILLNIKISFDHYNGINYLNNIKLPIIFPFYLKEFIDNIDKNKIYDYNFIGTITSNRKWINKFNNNKSIIKSSNNGRDFNKKYNLDKIYYETICKSKFTLAPTGDCPWSYRFFEAILGLSIPILEDNSKDIYKKNFFCYNNNDNHIYIKEKAIENYNKLIQSNHFLNKEILINSKKLLNSEKLVSIKEDELSNNEWFLYKHHFIKKNNTFICKYPTYLKKSTDHSSKNIIKKEIKKNDIINCTKIVVFNEIYYKIVIII